MGTLRETQQPNQLPNKAMHYQLRVVYVVFEIFSYEFAKKRSEWAKSGD